MKKENSIIVCPGSINPDFVILSDKPLHLVNRTTTFSGASSVYAGGKGRNQAVAAKKFSKKGSRTFLVGSVGDDMLGKNAISSLKKAGIETLFIKKSKDKETGKCILSLFKGGYQIVGLDLGANTCLTTKDIDKAEKQIAKSKILLCQIENTTETTAYALRLAKKNNCFTILNPSLVPQEIEKVTKEMFPYTDLLVLNVHEAEQLLQRNFVKNKDIGKAAVDFSSMGIPYVIITLGEKGSVIYHNGRHQYIPAKLVKEVDTTACGDIFVGALAAAILEEDDLSMESFVKCTKIATIAAALSVAKIGASESSPTRNEVLREL